MSSLSGITRHFFSCLIAMTILLSHHSMYAQYVGIGTDMPTQPLTVVGKTDVSGNLGIGTTNPLKRLDVNGDAMVNGHILGRGPGTTSQNTAFGHQVLNANNSSSGNIALGYKTLFLNTLGSANIGIGANVLVNNTMGTTNTSIGYNSTQNNTTGSQNTSIGTNAGPLSGGLSNTTAIGYDASVSSSNSVIVGNSSVNVGIGTSAPAERLDVVGLTKTTQLQMTNGAVLNHVMKSDASGNASWTSFPSIEEDPQVSMSTTNKVPRWNGTTLADGLVYDNGSLIGLGHTSPVAKLDVRGTNAGIRVLSGSSSPGAHTNIRLGRTSTNGLLGVAAADGHYAGGATAGDIILRQESATSAMILNTGSGNGTLHIENGKVGIGTMDHVNTLDVEGGLVVGSGYAGTATAPSNGALIQGFTGVGTPIPNSPFHVLSPYPKTDVTLRNVLSYTTNEPLSSDPFAMQFSFQGANVVDPRSAQIQTKDINQSFGGVLALQPAGGKVGVGTTTPTATLDVEGGIYNFYSGIVYISIPWSAGPVDYYINMNAPIPSDWGFSNTVVMVVAGLSETGVDIRKAELVDQLQIKLTMHTLEIEGYFGYLSYTVFKL